MIKSLKKLIKLINLQILCDMCRNDKNILKATAMFVVALIVFGLMNYHHTIIHSKMIKYNVQKQVDKHKEDSCKNSRI